jgi:transmembrane sensor
MRARIGWRALARYLAGESTAGEAAAIEMWAHADPKHAKILDGARHAWEVTESDATPFDTNRAWSSLAGRIAGSEAFPATSIPVVRPVWRRPVVWASGLLAAAIAFALLVPAVRRDAAPATKIFATGPENVTTVHLDDGSVVRLAPNTELKVAANGKREAWLTGTGFFAIAKRDGEPFVVHTAAGDARVLGTRFELSSAGRGVRLVVFEGRVALTATGGSEVVEAGQISSVEGDEAPLPARSADVQRLAPWLKGVLIFQATPLSAVAIEIQRQYGVRVHFDDEAISSRTVSAVFDHQPLQAVVAAICRVADATCEIQDTAVFIRP